jgi:hypothetical protein
MEALHALSALQAAREQEKTELDELVTVLSCEVVTKQNGQYLYNNAAEEDRWMPLVNLLERADYPEYALFDTYKALPLDKRERMKRRAKYNRDLFPEGKLLLNLRKWQGTLGLRKEALENERDPEDAAAYAFYRSVLLRVNTQIAALV